MQYGNDPINWREDAPDGTSGAANAFAPQIFSSGFQFGAGPTITIKFSKDVGDSLSSGDVSILNLTTGLTVDPAQVLFNYDSATQTASWQLAGDVADGNYQASMAATDVADAQARTLDANGDGTAGDGFTCDFFILAGDADHDRTVGFADLVAVAQNYGSTGGKTYEQGDFNFDGEVNFADLVTVAQRYGVTLAAPAAAPVAAVAPASAPVSEPAPAPVPAASESDVASGEAGLDLDEVSGVGAAEAGAERGLSKPTSLGVATAVESEEKNPSAVISKPAAPVSASEAKVGVKKPAVVSSPTGAGHEASPPPVFMGFGKRKIMDGLLE
jgi:hypothetical protein